jgi:hypothetical protein
MIIPHHVSHENDARDGRGDVMEVSLKTLAMGMPTTENQQTTNATP